MLTINLKNDNGNSEQIIEVRSCEMRKSNGSDSTGPHEDIDLKCVDANGVEFWINSGTAYVMNDKGMTVAKYWLGKQYLGVIPEPKAAYAVVGGQLHNLNA